MNSDGASLSGLGEPSPPMVDFTQGYGSFDFCPRVFVNDYTPHHASMKKRLVPREAFNPRRAVLEAGTRRAFPFMELPLEIRHHIYRQLLHAGIGRQGAEPSEIANSTEGRFLFRLAETEYNSETRDKAHDVFAAHVRDEPDKRNLSTASDSQLQPLQPRRVDVMELYETMQHAPPDILSRIQPSGWAASLSASLALSSRGLDTLDEEEANKTSDSGTETDSADQIAPAYMRQGYSLEVTLPTRSHHGCKLHAEHKVEPAWEFGQLHHLLFPARGLVACTCPSLLRDEYEWIRTLGQVSHRFTCELGNLLWTSAILHVDEPEVFLDFFRDRPALIPLVRRITLDTRCYGDAFDTMITTLRAICEFVSAHMRIRAFIIHLNTVLCVGNVGTDERFAANLEEAKALMYDSWADVFRGLRIQGSFTVSIQPTEFGNSLEGPDLENLTQKLQELWTPTSLA